jgi:hypothetical protein
MKKAFFPLITFCLLFVCCAKPVMAQNSQQELEALIRQKDKAFWDAYNRCDVAAMMKHFTTDVEFYHDKGGETKGLVPFTENTSKGLCGNEALRLRREEVAGSVEIFPMAKNGAIYGAIISGSHFFYVNEKGKAEYRDGLAKFTHLWLLEQGEWKMSRILSYDHGPASRAKTSK